MADGLLRVSILEIGILVHIPQTKNPLQMKYKAPGTSVNAWPLHRLKSAATPCVLSPYFSCSYIPILHYSSSFPISHIPNHSPITCRINSLCLGLLSKSTKIICCQVPKVNLPSTNGMVREVFSIADRAWEWPFPSCHLALCA